MVRAVAVKAMVIVSTKGLSAGRASEQWRRKWRVGGAERCRHHVDLLIVPEWPVWVAPAERVGVVVRHMHHQGVEG